MRFRKRRRETGQEIVDFVLSPTLPKRHRDERVEEVEGGGLGREEVGCRRSVIQKELKARAEEEPKINTWKTLPGAKFRPHIYRQVRH